MAQTTALPITSASYYQFISDEKLVGTWCKDCEKTYLPPRAICPGCHCDTLEWIELSGTGKIAAFTSIYISPTFMIVQGYGRDAPYLTGIIELDEGPKISARLIGLDASQPQVDWIGNRVSATFLKQGEGEEKKTVLAFRAR
jgi:uncharacterized OB-fold protein